MPNATPEVVDAYIAQRNDALANKLPVPPFPQAQGFATRRGAGLAHPRRGDDARWCNLRPRRGAAPVGDPRRPVIALLWQEGARAPPPPTPSPTRPQPTAAYPRSNTNGPSTSLICGSALRDLAHRARPARVLALVDGASSRRSCPPRRAPRSSAAAAAGARVRRRMRPCCGSRARPTARLRYVGVGARSRSPAMPTAVQQAGRAALDGAAQGAVRRRVGGAEGRRRTAAGPGAAQATRAARGRRGEPAADARLRSRPPHAVQARRALFRRGGRSAATRRRTRSASTGRPRCARRWPRRAARRELGRDGRRRHARRAWRRRSRDAPAARGSTCCPRRSAPRRVVAALAVLGAACGAVALVALVAIVLPLWQKRDYVIALTAARPSRRGCRPTPRCAAPAARAATGDYNYVARRKYAFPSAVQVLDDVTQAPARRHLAHAARGEERAKGKETQREMLLRGESANAGRLVSLLEESKVFDEAAPRSPTTKIQPGPGEIFDLGAQLQPSPPPPPAAARERRGPGCDAGSAGRRPRHRRLRLRPAPVAPARRRRLRPPRRLLPRRRRRPRRRRHRRRGGRVRRLPTRRRRRLRSPRRRPARRRQRDIPPPPGIGLSRPRQAAPPTDGRATASRCCRSDAIRRQLPRARGGRRNDCTLRSRRLRREQQRALAVALLVVAVVAGARGAAAAGRAAAPALRRRDRVAHRPSRALPARRRAGARIPQGARRDAREGRRRFFLKNTAPNLAGAELQELVRAAIENNGGRITTSQNQAPKDDGRSGRSASTCSSSRPRRTCRRSSTRSRRSSRISWSRT